VTGQTIVLAEGTPWWPPSVHDFYAPAIAPWGADGYHNPWITRITVMLWLSVAVIILYFLLSYRKPQLVPTKKQWLAESIYGFVRNNISVDMLGTKDGVRFAPYLATLFTFVFVMNLWGIIPFFQISPNSHIAFPAVLAVLTYVLFIYQGVKRHGAGYFKHALILPAPWFIQPILIPIEFFSTFIVRPFSLAVRLFANMFAGHMLLLVFTLGGFAMINANALLSPVSVLSWIMTILLTFLDFAIIALQAYVFTVLTASYIQGSLAEGH
jgi:F-type H+-transporting ATPase subunit a